MLNSCFQVEQIILFAFKISNEDAVRIYRSILSHSDKKFGNLIYTWQFLHIFVLLLFSFEKSKEALEDMEYGLLYWQV